MSLCKFLGFCFVVLTFNYAIAAGMNIGIITVVFNFVCITDSVIFYFFFGEKLTKGQLIGCFILLFAAFFISQKPPARLDQQEGTTTPAQEMEDYEKNINTWKATSSALVCILFFSCRDFLLRYYRLYKDYPAFEFSLDALFIYSFFCTVAGLYLFTFGGYTFHTESLYAGCMSAVLNTLGFMMLGISVVIGYAGPANALNSIQAVVLTLLGVSLLNQMPTQS